MTDWEHIELRLQVVDTKSGGSITWTTPDGILAALAEAGVLEVERKHIQYNWTRYVSPWKEAK